jgi:nucleoside phosphorylase
MREAVAEIVDFVIVTALEEERNALHALLPRLRRVPPMTDDTRVYYRSDLPVTFSDSQRGIYRLATLSLTGMGRVNAATATADAIRLWRPRFLLLVGIAGGVSAEGVALGDVLVSNQVVDYELQKLLPGGPQVRYEVHRADQRLLEAASDLTDPGWSAIAVPCPIPGKLPTRRIGPIATGDKVDAAGVLNRYRNDWHKLIGIEMEAGGAANAAYQSAIRPGFFMIRGVSDLADPDKGSALVDRWRNYACAVAAFYTVALLRRGPVPIQPDGHHLERVTPTNRNHAELVERLPRARGRGPVAWSERLIELPRFSPPMDELQSRNGSAHLSSGRIWRERALVRVVALTFAVGATIGALGIVVSTIKEMTGISEVLDLGVSASWILLSVFLLAGAWLLYVGTRRRSRLLRPEALALRADDPSHLRDREVDLEKLARLCQDRSLIFLVGESGAGKSALLRAGLCRPGVLAPAIVPVLVDVWGDDWINGPGRSLSEALRTTPALSEDDRAKLEFLPGARLPGIFAAVKRIKAKLNRRALLALEGREAVRWHFLRIGLENKDDAERLEQRAEIVAQATVGLDPRFRRRVIVELLIPTLAQPVHDPTTILACASLGRALHAGVDHESYLSSTCQVLARLVKVETDPRRLHSLAMAFAAVAKNAHLDQSKVVTQRLAEALNDASNIDWFQSTAAAFVAIAKDAKPELAEALAHRLAEALKEETDPVRLDSLAWAFAAMAEIAKPEQTEAVAKRLAQAVKDQTDLARLARLADAFVWVAKKADPKHVEMVTQRLVEAVSEEANIDRSQGQAIVPAGVRNRSDQTKLLATSLARVAKFTKTKTAEALAKRLTQALNEEADPVRLARLAEAFVAMSEIAKPEQTEAAAKRLAQAVKDQTDPDRLAWLADAFTGMAKKAKPEQVEVVTQRLTQEILNSTKTESLILPAKAFAAMVEIAKPEQTEAVAKRLAQIVKDQTDPTQLIFLAISFAEVAKFANPKHVEMVTQRLAQAVKMEPKLQAITLPAIVFAGMAKNATPDQVEIVTQRLADALKEKTDSDRLATLTEVYASVLRNARPGEAGTFFRSFALWMKTRGDWHTLSVWGKSIAELPDSLDPSDLANVLKYPNCTGDARSAILGHLAKILQIPWQPIDNSWRIITHDKLKLYVDRPLVAPPDWPTK